MGLAPSSLSAQQRGADGGSGVVLSHSTCRLSLGLPWRGLGAKKNSPYRGHVFLLGESDPIMLRARALQCTTAELTEALWLGHRDTTQTHPVAHEQLHMFSFNVTNGQGRWLALLFVLVKITQHLKKNLSFGV